MHRKPNRPAHDITQPFNSGIVRIYKTVNSAQPGHKAVEALKEPPVVLRYDEQRNGITRYFSALQTNIQIERVVRCPAVPYISTQDVAVTEDGRMYRIEQIQTVIDAWPACVDISLSKILQRLEVDKA